MVLLAQLFGSVWNTTTTTRHINYGKKPEQGPFQIVGTNDVPYADRVVACVRQGRKYEPRLLSSLLAAEGTQAILEDSTGTARHGYRLVQRRVGSVSDELDSAVYTSYCDLCSLISVTMDSILKACSALGYSNLTTDSLRVIESADSNRMLRIPSSLPVLIMPLWDNALQGRHAVPAWDGDACVFRLEDAYSGIATDSSKVSFRGVNQTVRHERTIQWLNRPNGVWQNGWYEDLDGGRWFSDVTSSNVGEPYNMTYIMFDMRSGIEMNCSRQEDCLAAPRVSRWGTKLTTYEYPQDVNSITILNATSFGLFLFETNQVSTVEIIYDWETLVSNVSVGLVLIRWTVILVAMHVDALRGSRLCFGGGIGCVSCYRNFDLLLISMVPQLKMTLTAFWTVGCHFEGQQVGLSEAWFTIYPAITQFMLMYFSLLNALAKITRRRMSDALFGPSVMFLCAIHYFRSDLAASTIITNVDGRVSTLVFSDEVKKMQLADYFVSGLAWRVNGRVTVLFWTKLAVLGINLVPLLLTRPFPVLSREKRYSLREIEQALAMKVGHVGGLGTSPVYLSIAQNVVPTAACGGKNIVAPACLQPHNRDTRHPIMYLNSYELLRLGYVVFGNCYIIAFDDWDILSSTAPLRSYYNFWNQRVYVWMLEDVSKNNSHGLRTLLFVEPEIWRLDDKRLKRIPWWQVSSCSVGC